MTGPSIWVRVRVLKKRCIQLYFYLLLFLLLLGTSVVVISGGECFPCPRLFHEAHEKSQSIK